LHLQLPPSIHRAADSRSSGKHVAAAGSLMSRRLYAHEEDLSIRVRASTMAYPVTFARRPGGVPAAPAAPKPASVFAGQPAHREFTGVCGGTRSSSSHSTHSSLG
jgi:hypothetical protein